jgi:hypothetical protein
MQFRSRGTEADFTIICFSPSFLDSYADPKTNVLKEVGLDLKRLCASEWFGKEVNF